MKKYLYIFKYTFINELSYFSKVIFRVVSYFLHIFVFYNVWKFIYQDNNTISGFSLTQMMWYLILAELFMMGVSRVAREKPINDIKSGSITYIMNKPYSYIGYIFTSYLAEGLVRLIIMIPISIVFGFVFVGPLNTFNIKFLGFMIISFILAYSINGLIQLLLSLFSFFIEDAGPIHWVYNKIILIFGVFFPIDMMLGFLQGILKYTPAYVVTYGPTKLIVDFDLMNAIKIISAQIIYLIIVLLLSNLIYRKGVKKLNVNGG
jgi:ABC-2 type transport system permease protein